MAIDEKLIDKRIVQRSVKKGLLSPEAVQEYLRALPDSTDKLESSPSAEPAGRGTQGSQGA